MQDVSAQLLAYSTAAIVHATVQSVQRDDALFNLTLEDGSLRHARRLVLATGVTGSRWASSPTIRCRRTRPP
jgi:thioredoxin reductase